MKPKRVLIFSLDYYPGEVGGAEIAIKEITDRIDPSLIEFHLLTLRYDTTMPKIEKIGNVLVHRIGFGWRNPTIAERRSFPLHYNKHLFQFFGALKAVFLYTKYRYDGIWAMMAHSCGVPAALFKWLYPQVPFLLTLQEGDPPEYIERVMRPVQPFFTRAFTTANKIQVISTFLGKWAKRMGYSGEPVLIPNAVNTKHFTQTYAPEVLDSIKKKIQKKEGDIFMITTSRMVEKNGLDTVIRALPLLPSTVHFLIYGGGPDESILRSCAIECGVDTRVHFGGLIDHSVMPQYLKACDIFIRPSRSEGMGNSFIEAMAAGLPVIATQEGGIADFLFDAKRNPEKVTTGWAVDVDTHTDIALAVHEIIQNPAQVQKVVKQAQDMVLKKYDWDTVASDMKEKVFDDMLNA